MVIDVRLGDYNYRLASGEWSDRFGIPPLRRTWRSLFADRQDVSGEPGIQNLRPDDLRWSLTSFAGGEGQMILKRGDANGERSFDRSEGIDLANPGQMVLGKALSQQGLTGTAPTTIEGSAMVDSLGTSTVVNATDRQLTNVTDEIKTAPFTPAAGTRQAEFYGYISGPAVIEGITDFPRTGWIGGRVALGPTGNHLIRTPAPGSITSTPKNVAVDDETEATFVLRGVRKVTASQTPEWVTVDLVVRSENDTLTLAHKTNVRIDSESGNFDEFARITLNFQPTPGDSGVLYRIRLVAASPGVKELEFDRVEQRPLEPKVFHWSVFDETASVEVIGGDVDLNHIETSQRLAAASWVADGVKSYSLRVRRDSGVTRAMRVDKVSHAAVTLKQPWNLDLGASGLQWLADWSDTVAPALFYWDAATSEWETVGNIGAAVGKPIAMSGDDTYEYVLLDTKIVYRTKLPLPATITAWTAAIPDAAAPVRPRTPVGMTVAADRVWVLCMDEENGVELLSAPVSGAAPVAWTIIPVTTASVTGKQEFPRQMAPTAVGPVFFVNHGSRCQVSLYNAGQAAIEKVTSIDGGFQGKAIVHTGGTTIVGGTFSAADSASTRRNRPALHLIEHETFFAEPLVGKLYRDEDLDTSIQSMQLYGPDLYILAQVRTPAENKRLRLWRVSLAAPGGVFLEHELVTDASQQAYDARALAVNLFTRVVAWGIGNPYIEQEDYRLNGTLRSSSYEFGLLEEKVATAIDVDGEFGDPAHEHGSAIISYRADEQDEFTDLVTVTAPGRVTLPQAPRFHSVAFQITLTSSDPSYTPRVRRVDIRAELAGPTSQERAFEVFLDCTDSTSSYHPEDRQVPGVEAAQYLWDLAEQGEVVEFVNYFRAKKPEQAEKTLVRIENPEQLYLTTGESLMRVRLKELV